jgi:hypothetical protein
MKISYLKFSALGIFSMACLQHNSFSQGYFDNVLRFGQPGLYGSVKAMGMGGVQNGVGADGSAQFSNPAAPGMFRRSDIQFSLMPVLNGTENTFNGSLVRAEMNRAPIGSFSLSLANPKDDIVPGSFRGGVFTLSYNRLAVFDRKSNWEGDSPLYIKGQRTDNSIIDYYLNNSNKPGYYFDDIISADPNNQPIFSESFKNDLVMAYDAFLIDRDSLNFNSILPRGDLSKTGYWKQKLDQGAWNLGYAANFNDNLYLGASVGLQTGSMEAEVQYGEAIQNIDPADPNLINSRKLIGVNFQIYRTLNQSFRALSGNVGMVYKISDGFRISYAMQLPSISWITEKFAPRVVSDFIGFNYPGVGPLGKSDVNWFENEYSYKMRLPARHRLGFTYIESKKGMAGLELEYADMSAARLSEGDGNYNFREENAIVSNQYRPTLSVKAGGEICFENLRFRAGYAFLPGALASGAVFSDNVHGDAHYFTGGLGGRYDVWYWDAALVYGVWKTRYNFLPAVMDDVVIQASSTQLRMGVGFYF